MTSPGSLLAGWGLALALCLFQAMVWLATMSGTDLASGVVIPIFLLWLALPATGAALLSRNRPQQLKGFLTGMAVIWSCLIGIALLLALLLGTALGGLGAR
ncbi:hypothetical protein HNP46_005898 [Pseudomonas nitritireducens]|uniref:Uncharacterized protein n=1 Tax=Pseudomonas nitroreducens TaxID=46680 RepID=A0A7W7P4T2_PSENT|nr:hypothetical protein [Pseudomonas nitritireducens]MBB4866990.1 hypothetical protein [Pseudomonas nitritireducens]